MATPASRRSSAPITLDVEASGFGRGSYPIEIGVAFPDQQVESYLIRPVPEWTHWDPAAEAVHGIAREQLLAEGRSVHEVAALLNARLAGNRAYSDAWSFDTSWIARLFDASGISQHFRVDTVRNLLDESEVELWQQARERVAQRLGPTEHRAAGDARRLQLTVLEVWRLAAEGRG